MQNLLPDFNIGVNSEQTSDVYVYRTSIANVIKLDLSYLTEILANDFERLQKFWGLIAYRLITINCT